MRDINITLLDTLEKVWRPELPEDLKKRIIYNCRHHEMERVESHFSLREIVNSFCWSSAYEDSPFWDKVYATINNERLPITCLSDGDYLVANAQFGVPPLISLHDFPNKPDKLEKQSTLAQHMIGFTVHLCNKYPELKLDGLKEIQEYHKSILNK